jgi:hypothetical protein
MNVKAVGHVVVEDGKQRRQGNEATVEFDAPDPLSFENSRFPQRVGKRVYGSGPFPRNEK